MTKTADQKIKQIAVDELTPYERNSRTHSPEQITQIAASIQEFGFVNPVLIDSDNMIVADHGRVVAAKQLGLASVPCLAVEGLSKEQIRAYIIADNKLAENAGWDMDKLRFEIGELNEIGFDINLIGFVPDEIQELLTFIEPNPGLVDEDEVPEVPEEPITKPGNVWDLGRHRIICGDCTDAAVVSRLLRGGAPRT